MWRTIINNDIPKYEYAYVFKYFSKGESYNIIMKQDYKQNIQDTYGYDNTPNTWGQGLSQLLIVSWMWLILLHFMYISK